MERVLTAEQLDAIRRIRLDYAASEGVQPDLDNGEPNLALWSVTATVVDFREDDEEAEETRIGDFLIAVGSLWDPGLLEASDALSGDVFAIVEAIIDFPAGDPAPVIADKIEGTTSPFAILDRAELVPEWRGFGLGPFLAGVAIRRLLPVGAFAATIPAPTLGDHHDVSRQAARRKLERTWGSLGFERATDEVWVLDLATVALDEALRGYRTKFGLA